MEKEEDKTIKFYILEHPETGYVRYIGKTVQSLERRLYSHLRCRFESYKSNWIKSLRRKGLTPKISLIEEIEYTENWEWLEEYWISQFRAWGFRITNMTDGGDGNNNQIFSRESIEKRNSKLRGRKRPQWVRDKISKAKKGVPKSEEVKRKISETLTGKKQSEETKKKRYKPVIQYDLEGNKLKEFPYLRKAAKAVNGSPGPISNACKGVQNTAYGYKWRYKEDIV